MVRVSRRRADPGSAERGRARCRLHRRPVFPFGLRDRRADQGDWRHPVGRQDAGDSRAQRFVDQDRRRPQGRTPRRHARRLGQFLIDATLEKTGFAVSDATFAPLGPVDAKIALLAGSIDGWAVWEPYVSYATLKDNARVIADGEGLTPTITFLVASDQAIATKRAAVQDLVQRLNKARLWSLDHLSEYAWNTAELTKLPQDVLLSAYTAQRTSPIVIDESIVKEVQEASDRATRYGILSKTLDVGKAVDRSFTTASAGSN